MDTIKAWKDPEYRRSLGSGALPQHPSGVVALDDGSLDDVVGGTTWPCATIAASIAITIAFCSPNGTGCGSCGFGTSGCC